MIIDAIADVSFSWFIFLLRLLPFRDLTLPNASIDAFLSYVDMAAYFVPINVILMLLTFLFVKEGIKILISFIRFLIKFVPFIG